MYMFFCLGLWGRDGELAELLLSFFFPFGFGLFGFQICKFIL